MAVYGPIGVTTTGSAGSATGSTTTVEFPPGTLLECVKIDYHASAPATTDLTITEAEGLQRDVLTLTDTNTDGTYYPRHGEHDPDGTAGSGVGHFVIEGALTIALAQSDALTDAVLVTFQTMRNKDLV